MRFSALLQLPTTVHRWPLLNQLAVRRPCPALVPMASQRHGVLHITVGGNKGVLHITVGGNKGVLHITVRGNKGVLHITVGGNKGVLHITVGGNKGVLHITVGGNKGVLHITVGRNKGRACSISWLFLSYCHYYYYFLLARGHMHEAPIATITVR